MANGFIRKYLMIMFWNNQQIKSNLSIGRLLLVAEAAHGKTVSLRTVVYVVIPTAEGQA